MLIPSPNLFRARGLFRRTRCPCLLPLVQKIDQLRGGIGRRLPPGSRRPSPLDQRFILDVLDYLIDGPAVAIARWILDLGADLGARLAEPLHHDRRKRPGMRAGSAGRTMRHLRVLGGMTGAAAGVFGADAAYHG